MARSKDAERRQARTLREQGWSLRRIANELEVSLSSVSTWVRDIAIPVAPITGEETVTAPAATISGTRRCAGCGLRRSLADFNRSGDGYQWWCRDCYREYFRERGDLHRRQSGDAKRRRQLEARKFLLDYLHNRRCADCGEADMTTLEFDHRGAKTGYVPVMAASGVSLKRLKEEVSGCDVVCVNCHRRRTAARGQWRRSAANWRTIPTSRLKREKENIDFAYETLERWGCTDCGVDELCVLDFDHVDGKEGHVIELARNGWGRARIEKEIARCEIRCGNCHRRRTAREMRSSRWSEAFA